MGQTQSASRSIFGSTSSNSLNSGSTTNKDEPTEEQIQQILNILQTRLPTEVALNIIDLAELWPKDTFASQEKIHVHAGLSGDLKSRAVLLSPPLRPGATETPVRRLIVTITSRDQGFSSFLQFHGTRQNSSSWFELAIVRSTKDPITGSELNEIIERQQLIYNIHASTDFNTSQVVLNRGHPCVDSAMTGDRWAVFAMVQYPMWSNLVNACQLELQRAVV
ncbi:hypothetical protein OIO90_002311 [Microbotryomycetes sp. JL221]|nr:hypothetical protein OIO90_002311 [Microbotryomycetes sp. JL221]